MLTSRLYIVRSNVYKISQSVSMLIRRNINTEKKIEDKDNKPISYSQSEAAKWKAVYNRIPPNLRNRVWYTDHVVVFCTAIFLLYFLVLREENDIDELIYKPLPETIRGIEKVYPNANFNVKPDYVLHYEKKKQMKEQLNNNNK